MDAPHVTPETSQLALGSIAAQGVIEALRDEMVSADQAWLRYLELAAQFGKNSPACRAFVCEAFKRAAAG